MSYHKKKIDDFQQHRKFPTKPLIKRKYLNELESSESDSTADIHPSERPLKARLESFKTRTIWTLLMFGGFLLIVAAGHLYCCLLVLLANTFIYKEILSIKRNEQRDSKLPFFYIINWYFFILTELCTTSILLEERILLLGGTAIELLYQYHYVTFFSLYVLGIVLFVISLRKGSYKYQFMIFAWTHIACLLVVTQSTTILMNIYTGLIWFLLPALLVVVNDCFSYIFGVFFGRIQLIKVVPDKTLEGFIGGLLSTIISAYILSHALAQYDYFLCPQPEIILTPFTSLTCNSEDILMKKERILPWVFQYIGLSTINASSLELHAMVLGVFAGFIAPFGGFFASGVKRAFNLKVFGDSIPGHGGITDRMDCQIMMGMFTFVWIHSIVLKKPPSIASVMVQVMSMEHNDQVYLLEQLKEALENRNN
ncbi:CDS1_1 [Blepharisma stoltei]|uniref:Phosphatidate cytidylyltransferase n=1 Tax=Blepharisma stoltei TaxID=1481888 RepID=A0AAU9ICP6_9CILI|nr:unnamed protein product [Blepharisma stoltei]